MKEKQGLPSILCSLSSSSCLLQEVLQTPASVHSGSESAQAL